MRLVPVGRYRIVRGGSYNEGAALALFEPLLQQARQQDEQRRRPTGQARARRFIRRIKGKMIRPGRRFAANRCAKAALHLLSSKAGPDRDAIGRTPVKRTDVSGQ
jgi:hypothetical protein